MNIIDESLEKSSLSFETNRVVSLKHIVGAHHGHRHDGHMLSPATPEARIVQLLDEMDATLDAAA